MRGLSGVVVRLIAALSGYARRRTRQVVPALLALVVVAAAIAQSPQPTSAAPTFPVNTVLPSLSGIASDGVKLTATNGTWTGGSIAYSRQWLRCDDAGSGCVVIAGATALTYTLKSADVASTIRVRVTATNSAGTATADSVETAVVAAVVPSATRAPVLSGTAKDGRTLTATSGTWAGTIPFVFGYQWLGCNATGGACGGISGAVAPAYTLTSDEVGKTIRVRVGAVNVGGSGEAESVQSAVVVAAAPTSVAVPAFTGLAKDGQTLSGADGTWAGTVPITLTRQWRRCGAAGGGCANIAGATGLSYTLVAADVGKTLRLRNTATNVAGTASAQSAPSALVTTSAPVNTSPPALTGTPRDGQTLTAASGTWVGTGTITTSRQWLRCDASGASCATISGQAGASYALAPADVGSTIRVRITATNATGSTTAESAPTADVSADPPAELTAPSLSGTASDGQALASTNGTWTGTTPLAYSRQWRRCDVAGSVCIDIAGATAATYTLTSADVGSTIRVSVTASNGAGTASSSSSPTAVVAAVIASNSAPPQITGAPVDGSALTAGPGAWWGTMPLSYSYRWRACDSAGAACADIAGATSQTFSPGPAQIGARIRVAVTASNSAGAMTATSTATSAVLAAPPATTTLPEISGTLSDGGTLSATGGVWEGTAPIEFARQWERCDWTGSSCTPVLGATAATYTLTSADIGLRVRVVITGSNAVGTVSAASAVTAPVDPAPAAATGPPTISGTPTDGQTLTTSDGAFSGTLPLSYSYQWRRCDVSGDACVDIAGATDADYTLSSADVGARLRSRVTGANTAGSDATTSAPTTIVGGVEPANLVVPAISGNAILGASLTASDDGGWSGSTPLAFGYRWQRCAADGTACSDIAGATSITYTLMAADVGARLRVAVTATNTAGSATASSTTSDVVAGGGPPVALAPSIAGSPVAVAGVLTASAGASGGSAGDIAYSYQWQRCDASGSLCTDISGATRRTKNVATSEIGARLRVHVTAILNAVSTSATSPVTALVTAERPANREPSLVYGNTAVGRVLTASHGSWSPTYEMPAYSYRWQRCDSDGHGCQNIAAATASTYTPESGDVGGRLVVVVTAVNSGGQTSVASAPSALVRSSVVLNTAAPTITSAAGESGTTLTADPGSWQASATPDFGYRWQRCVAASTVCVNLQGANDQSYDLSAQDAGSTLRVLVTASASGGSASAISQTTSIVAAAAPSSVQAPEVNGDPLEPGLVTVDGGTWTGSGPVLLGYQWQRCDATGANCADIADATDVAYEPVSADVGATLRAQITATNEFGSATVQTTATAAVEHDPSVLSTTLTASTPPTVTGSEQDGQTLAVDPGTWTSSGQLIFAYQWERCDPAGQACEGIAGATSATYELTEADVGAAIGVVVIASDATGSAQARAVTGQSIRSLTGPQNTTAPAITGSAVEGQPLAATTGSWSASVLATYSYQWQLCDPPSGLCDDIPDATSAIYTPAPDDVGGSLRVSVSAVDGPDSTTAVSAQTEVVTPVTPHVAQAPVITGVAQSAQTLSATAGTWDGPAPISYSFQWRSCDIYGDVCRNIVAATTDTYAVQEADEGRTIQVAVTATNPSGTAAASSEATDVVVSPANATLTNTAGPSVSGFARETEPLSASAGTWASTQTITYSYQWRRCTTAGSGCVNIAGAREATYTPGADDVGARLRASVTASVARHTRTMVTPATATVLAIAPVNTLLPVISGEARDGGSLAVSTGDWLGHGFSYEYQWQRCDALGTSCTDRDGETGDSYSVVADDVGSSIRVLVTAVNAAGRASVTALATTMIAARPPMNLVLPEVYGDAVQGATLSLSFGYWEGTPELLYAYQWQRCDSAGADCTNIQGATSETHQLGPQDTGGTLRAVVTASNAASVVVATSPVTAVIEPPQPPVNDGGAPSIYGATNDGDQLYADAGGWSGTPASTFSYQWRRCDAAGNFCADIAGATADSYTLHASDLGSTIRVQVTATNPSASASAASAPTSAIATAAPASSSPPSISGDAHAGSQLAADPGTWSGSKPQTYAYQWQRCDAAGENCADIDGATADTFTLAASDENTMLGVVVTASNSHGNQSATAQPVFVNPPAPQNTSLPTTGGDPFINHQLTASPGTWSPEADSYEYAWEQCETDGPSCYPLASGRTFTPTFGAGFRRLRVTVTAHLANDHSAHATSELTAPIAFANPANQAPPVITGAAVNGGTLTLDRGTWSGMALNYSYRWQRCYTTTDCTDIPGATSLSYTLSGADVGVQLRARVRASNSSGTVEVYSERTSTVSDPIPVNLTLPSLSGDPVAGGQLQADTGTWSSRGDSARLQWQRCTAAGTGCADIPQATGLSYEPAGEDVGVSLRVVVTTFATAGQGRAESAPSEPIAGATRPQNTSAPSVTGTLENGEMLTATPGTWSGSPQIRYAYDWQRCSAAGSGCADITGATESSYQVRRADADSTLRILVTATNGWGAVSVTSAVTDVVPAPPLLANIAPPAILPWQYLAFDYPYQAQPGSWAGDPDVASQWQRCDPLTENPIAQTIDCIDIPGADDARNYVPTVQDIGFDLRLKETASTQSDTQTLYTNVTSPVDAYISDTGAAFTGIAVTGLAITAGTQVSAPEGLPVTKTYRFERRETDGPATVLQDGSQPSYTLTDQDVGHEIDYTITITVARADNATTFSSWQVSGSTPQIETLPVNDTPPAVQGDPVNGATLTPSPGSWHGGGGTLQYTYQWQRCTPAGENCIDIDSATAAAYQLTDADIASTLRVQVTAANGTASATATSPVTTQVEQATPPAVTAAPQISGTTRELQTLTADPGTWTGSQPITYTYQWQTCASDGSDCTDIDGATDRTLKPASDEVGGSIRVAVTATNAAGTATGLSGATDAIAEAPAALSTAAPSLTILGPPAVGSTATTDGGGWEDADTDTLEYQWQRCTPLGENCQDIPDADSADYDLTSDDQGSVVRVQVRATNHAGDVVATSELSPIITASQGSAAGRLVFLDDSSIYLMDADGTAVTEIADCTTMFDNATNGCTLARPTISPSGKMVAVQAHLLDSDQNQQGPGQIVLMNFDGSNPRTLITNAGAPAWTAEGTSVLFERPAAGESGPQPGTHIYRTRADASDATSPTQITSGSGGEGSPDASPDGLAITYTARAAGATNTSLYLANPDGSGATRLNTGPEIASTYDPQFSPDGTQVLFTATLTSQPASVRAPLRRTWTITPGGDAHALATDDANYGPATVTPDGQSIITTRRSSTIVDFGGGQAEFTGPPQAWATALDGSNPHAINTPGNARDVRAHRARNVDAIPSLDGRRGDIANRLCAAAFKGNPRGLVEYCRAPPTASVNAAISLPFIGPYKKLTAEEKAFCRRIGYLLCFSYLKDSNKAFKLTDHLFLPRSSGDGSARDGIFRETRANAFQHSFWVALMVNSRPQRPELARDFAKAHEGGADIPNPALRSDSGATATGIASRNSRMDMLNNRVGWEFGKRYAYVRDGDGNVVDHNDEFMCSGMLRANRVNGRHLRDVRDPAAWYATHVTDGPADLSVGPVVWLESRAWRKSSGKSDGVPVTVSDGRNCGPA